MTLTRCGSGQARIIEAEPAIETCRRALYVPAAGDWDRHGWGLYDAGDRLIVSAAHWTDGADGAPEPSSGAWTAPADAIREARPAEAGVVHVYGGLLEAGEFLSGALSRFWSYATRPGQALLLFHARAPVADLFDTPVVGATLRALGVDPADCVVLDRPTRLECVIVPAPAFETGRLAFPAYGRLAATLAIRLAGRTLPADLGRAPLHVSSARGAEPAIAGEEAFDETLRRHGVAVIHPGEMSFAALLGRVRAAALVSSTAPAGMAGAGDHAAAFRAAGSRMVLCPAPSRDALNIDALCGHDTLTLCPSGDAADAVALGEAYARAMRRLIVSRRLACDMTPDGARPDLGPAAVACTSSDDGDAARLVGGLLTGAAQALIAGSQYPWWQAEFANVVEIEAVRVHGPISGDQRAAGLRLLGSIDARDWTVLDVRDRTDPIGGIDGNPHTFEARGRPWRVRIVRLQSTTGVLPLDQVEILSAAMAPGECDEIMA